MPVEPEANQLLTRSPLALLIAMLLDQQVPLERAFSAPLDLVRRLGHEPTAAGPFRSLGGRDRIQTAALGRAADIFVHEREA